MGKSTQHPRPEMRRRKKYSNIRSSSGTSSVLIKATCQRYLIVYYSYFISDIQIRIEIFLFTVENRLPWGEPTSFLIFFFDTDADADATTAVYKNLMKCRVTLPQSGPGKKTEQFWLRGGVPGILFIYSRLPLRHLLPMG